MIGKEERISLFARLFLSVALVLTLVGGAFAQGGATGAI